MVLTTIQPFINKSGLRTSHYSIETDGSDFDIVMIMTAMQSPLQVMFGPCKTPGSITRVNMTLADRQARSQNCFSEEVQDPQKGTFWTQKVNFLNLTPS